MASNISVEEAKKIRRQYRQLSIATVIVISIGVVFMRFVERLEWVDAFYFSVVSLTTVGYGDITPETDVGKIFVAFYLIIGIGIIAGFANTIIKNAVAKRVINRNEKVD